MNLIDKLFPLRTWGPWNLNGWRGRVFNAIDFSLAAVSLLALVGIVSLLLVALGFLIS